jgi:hypothetical protein
MIQSHYIIEFETERQTKRKWDQLVNGGRLELPEDLLLIDWLGII